MRTKFIELHVIEGGTAHLARVNVDCISAYANTDDGARLIMRTGQRIDVAEPMEAIDEKLLYSARLVSDAVDAMLALIDQEGPLSDDNVIALRKNARLIAGHLCSHL